MHRDDEALLNDICDSIKDSFDIVRDMDYSKFHEDKVRQYAIIRLLEIIGEAANQISQDHKENNPDVPWKKMISMRNRLIHGYFSVNDRIVWDTVHFDLAILNDLLECKKRKIGD